MAEIDDMTNLPEWVQAIVKLGVPSVALIFLVYWLTSSFDKRLDAMEGQHLTIAERAAHAADTNDRGLVINERILRVLLADCVNHATTTQNRKDCIQ